MAVTSARVPASLDRVWAVLSDGWTYSNWVVGTSHVRAVDENWPQVGSRVFHASGVWPLVRRDETVVETVDPGRRLVLTAKARPFGEALIVLELRAEGDGNTHVVMTETPSAGPGRWLHNPGADRLLKHRNDEALGRLSALVERRHRPRER